MKRTSWFIAILLILFGSAFLFSAGLGLHSMSMMNSMDSMPMTAILIMHIVMWGGITLGCIFLVLYFRFLQTPPFTSRCSICHGKLQPGWSYCPHCGHRVHDHQQQKPYSNSLCYDKSVKSFSNTSRTRASIAERLVFYEKQLPVRMPYCLSKSHETSVPQHVLLCQAQVPSNHCSKYPSPQT